MKRKTLIIIMLLLCIISNSQVLLNANGPGNTYEEITAVLAPGYNPIEVPDCSHSSFGRHIDEVFDAELNTHVFRFHIHVASDDDRCINFDRQRNEIKSYDKSPDNLLGVENEVVVYKWKFKLASDLQVSSSFTHIHQLKSVGGSLASMPMYTLTLRKSNPDRLELRYAETTSQITLKQTDLQPFKGTWVEVTETIQYGASGTYSISINRVSDNAVLFQYSNNAIVNWRPNADFVRPKWGIYRSLNSAQDLKDEMVLFANFSIEELTALSIDEVDDATGISIYPNPTSKVLTISEKKLNSYHSLTMVNQLGQVILEQKADKKSIDVSGLAKGIYSIIFLKNNTKVSTKKLLVK